MAFDGPAIIVRGTPVSEEQAAEILIRTQFFSLDTIHRPTRRAICRLLNVQLDPADPDGIDTEALMNLIDEYQCLPLYHLRNHQICSTSQFGPHGWCTWSGRIGCSGYNLIGDPLAGELKREWRKIAIAWPFLSLRAQLFDSSIEDLLGAKPIVEYRVHNGQLDVVEGNFTPFLPEEHPMDRLQREVLATQIIPAEFREMGISLPRLFTALQITRHRLGLPPLPERKE